jgi:predicted DNA-binding transcriptional regulator AlpA
MQCRTTPTTPLLRKFLDESETCEYASASRSSIRRWEQAGLFPKRVKIGPNRVAWRLEDLQAWADALEEAS